MASEHESVAKLGSLLGWGTEEDMVAPRRERLMLD